MPMFKSILIANRGEIAVRIAQTAKKMGIYCVAVFSRYDQGAFHVKSCDQAIEIIDYLNGAKIIEAAICTKVEAIHPGYGFLSENADFASAVQNAGLIFIGPPVTAIETMGSKVKARRLMEISGVPLVPGYNGKKQDYETLYNSALKIGFPVLIKPSAGGGGRGLQIVQRPQDLEIAIQTAKREAREFFNDSTLIIEKYLNNPRHIEIQIFADQFGNFVNFVERDCSIQRRNQKVLEESPAPKLSKAIRDELSEVAKSCVRATGYFGAGTVEFLLTSNKFYFIEMNTRLQVEHPVTEMIYGEDLVEWQFQVAAGFELPLLQEDLSYSGHAIEARLYAEDATNSFLPTFGKVERFSFPNSDVFAGTVRIDRSLKDGERISTQYDPLIAKIIVWGDDRGTATRRLARVLKDVDVGGVTTNLQFLRRISENKSYILGKVDTGFINRHYKKLCFEPKKPRTEALILATLAYMLRLGRENIKQTQKTNDIFSPWGSASGWSMFFKNFHVLNFLYQSSKVTYEVIVYFEISGFTILIEDTSIFAEGFFNDEGRIVVNFQERQIEGMVHFSENKVVVDVFGQISTFILDEQTEKKYSDIVGVETKFIAPMPGRIVKKFVKVGDRVVSGDPLIILEAMKMEHTITATCEGIIAEVFYNQLDIVDEGALLLTMDYV